MKVLADDQIPWDNRAEYEIYLACADDGNGGDITRGGQPLLTFEEWLEA